MLGYNYKAEFLRFNSLFARDKALRDLWKALFTYKCRLLITFANSLDTDQTRHNVGPAGSKLFDTHRWYS